MKIYNVTDKEFASYGKIVFGFDNDQIVNALDAHTPLSTEVVYVPSEPMLENLTIFDKIQNNMFGGMPCQLGYCNGYNTKLNCLEYHRDSEFNIGSTDFILLLAHESKIENGVINTDKVEAFLCPKGTMVEVYATTLHYAPCSAKKGEGFKVMVALPKGTNTEMSKIVILNNEDKMLWARNKWLIAHNDTNEAKLGAYTGLIGENINIENII